MDDILTLDRINKEFSAFRREHGKSPTQITLGYNYIEQIDDMMCSNIEINELGGWWFLKRGLQLRIKCSRIKDYLLLK